MTEFRVPIRPEVDALPRYAPGKAMPGADKISSNEMPEPPSRAVIEAARRALDRVNRYPDLTAAPVREALAPRFGVCPEQICVGTGSSAILVAALTAVCIPGAEVVYPWRSFESYPIAIPASHGTPVPVDLDEDGRHDLDAMAAAVTDRTVAVIVCSPNNPTGPAVSLAEITAFVETLPAEVLVMIDEAYIDFSTDPAVGTAVPLIEEHPNVLVMRTFSKVHALAGARIGYAIGSAKMISAIQAVLVPFGVSTVAQAAALASLEDDEAVRGAARTVVAERERVIGELRGLGYDVPDSQSNFYFLRGEGRAFIEAAAAERLVVRPFPEGVRVSVGSVEQNDRLLAAARALR